MRKRKQPDYITMRVEQLKEDMEKASNPYDKQWYNRIIQELCWAQMTEKKIPGKNCYMEASQ
jgi:hypothetical protein